jgi:hypothetical protein
MTANTALISIHLSFPQVVFMKQEDESFDLTRGWGKSCLYEYSGYQPETCQGGVVYNDKETRETRGKSRSPGKQAVRGARNVQ